MMEDEACRPAKRGRDDSDELASEGHTSRSSELGVMSAVARSQPEASLPGKILQVCFALMV